MLILLGIPSSDASIHAAREGRQDGALVLLAPDQSSKYPLFLFFFSSIQISASSVIALPNVFFAPLFQDVLIDIIVDIERFEGQKRISTVNPTPVRSRSPMVPPPTTTSSSTSQPLNVSNRPGSATVPPLGGSSAFSHSPLGVTSGSNFSPSVRFGVGSLGAGFSPPVGDYMPAGTSPALGAPNLNTSAAGDETLSLTTSMEDEERKPMQFIATRRELLDFRSTDEQTLITQLVNVVTHFLWKTLLS